MAHQPLFRFPPADPTAEQLKRASQEHRRNLRIAVRQLERAELYIVALLSLRIDDATAEASVDDLIGRLRAVQRHLLELKLAA